MDVDTSLAELRSPTRGAAPGRGAALAGHSSWGPASTPRSASAAKHPELPPLVERARLPDRQRSA